jgi:hypothetical protein
MSGGEGGNRWWIGAALVPFILLAGLRGLRNTELVADSPLGHWYGQLALLGLSAAGYAAVYLLVRRAYRRRP